MKTMQALVKKKSEKGLWLDEVPVYPSTSPLQRQPPKLAGFVALPSL